MGSICITPLVEETLFPDNGGYIPGRWCRTVANVSCCLPCPVTDWRYSDGFEAKEAVASYLAVAVVAAMVFMALTYIFLPANETARHYLTTAPMIGFVFMSTAYIVPLGRSPNQCYDEITPNDAHSDSMCLATGLLLMAGIWVVVIGCLFRSLSLHLMVVWERTLGNKYMYSSLACIILGSLLLLVLDLEVTGVSYQLGKVCYINPWKGWGTFWIPLLVISGLTFLFQVLTMAYCVFIVIRPIWHERTVFFPRRKPRTSVEYRRGAEARQASVQTRKILRMQWRPVLIVFMIVLNVVLLSTVFLEAEGMYTYPTERFLPWIECLILNGKDKCMDEASKLGPSENLIVAIIVLLAVCGVWGVVLVFRSSMLFAWIDLFRGSPKSNLRRLDAEANAQLRYSPHPRSRSRNSDCELTRLPKHQTVASITEDDAGSDHTHVLPDQNYIVPQYSFSAPVRPKASYVPPSDW